MKPRNRGEDEALSVGQRRERARALAAAATARRSGGSRYLAPSARSEDTSVATVGKWLPDIVRKDDAGRWTVTAADRAYRLVSVVERGGGVVEVPTHGSRVATLASRYAHALDQYRSGLRGPEVFARFEGKRVGGVELETDADRIEELEGTGMLDDFEFHSEKL